VTFQGSQRLITGKLGINMIRNEIAALNIPFRGNAGPGQVINKLFNRPEAIYHHERVDTYIYGSHPASIIQGSKNIYKSIYLKRCNGEYVHGLGEAMKDGPIPRGMTSVELSKLERIAREKGLDETLIAEASWCLHALVRDIFRSLTGGLPPSH
jgi:hypothetical protein